MQWNKDNSGAEDTKSIQEIEANERNINKPTAACNRVGLM
jgi:hypothetical protein